MNKVPEVWKRLGSYLHQDYMVMYPDFWSGIDEFLSSLDNSDREKLVQFLESLVENEQPGGTLKSAWAKSGSQLLFSRVDLKALYSQLLNHSRNHER